MHVYTPVSGRNGHMYYLFGILSTHAVLFFPSRNFFTRKVDDYQDPQLQELARKLSNTLLHSQANSTAKKYLAAFKRWKVWALKYGMTVLPANDCQLALYLKHIGDIEGSKASVEEAGNALAWVHTIPLTTGFPNC